MTRNSRIYRWSRWAGGVALLAASTAMAPNAGAFEAAETSAATGAATVVDLQTAPNLPNVPQQQINTLHNNISWANHLIAKQKAAASLALAQLKAAGPVGFVPTLRGINIAGINQGVFGGFPPDGDIAVSNNFVLHIVNFGVSIYDKAGGLQTRKNFATFFHNTTDFIFDPRAYWDPYWDRFVVMADGQSGSKPNQQSWFELAISTTNNPNGSYFIYRFTSGAPPRRLLGLSGHGHGPGRHHSDG